MEFGKYIRDMRTQKKETLHQVAKGTDIDMTLLSKIERSERLPTFEQAKRISSYFCVEENKLISMLTAEKILHEYGMNDNTLNAVYLVSEKIVSYNNDKDR